MPLGGSVADDVIDLIAGVVLFTLLLGAAVLSYAPSDHARQERQRIDQEARLAQWRVQQVTAATLRQLLEKARQDR